MLGIYYGNVWDAKTQPFMSTRLRTIAGGAYPVTKLFTNGTLDEAALARYGVPRLTGSFAYAIFMANAAVRLDFILLLISDWSAHHARRPLLGQGHLAYVQVGSQGSIQRQAP